MYSLDNQSTDLLKACVLVYNVLFKCKVQVHHTNLSHNVYHSHFFQDSSCFSLDAYGFLLEATLKYHYVVLNTCILIRN